MANIQLPTTRPAGTGTGALLTPYRLAGDLAVYRESNPTGAAAVLQYRRTEPKATKDYAGALRGESKFTRQYADANGKLWPAVLTVNSSVPAFLTDAQKATFIGEAMIASHEASSLDVLSKLLIPQS